MSHYWNAAKARTFTPRSSRDGYCRHKTINDNRTKDITNLTLMLTIFRTFYVCHRALDITKSKIRQLVKLHWHMDFTELHRLHQIKELTMFYGCLIGESLIVDFTKIWLHGILLCKQKFKLSWKSCDTTELWLPELWLPRTMTFLNNDFPEI